MAKAKAKSGELTAANFDPDKYQYNNCREQHHWQPYDGRIDNKAKIAHRVQRCDGCGMKKHSQLSLYPEDYGQHIKSPVYTPPPGYRIAGGIGTFERGLIRVHNFMVEVKTTKK